MKRLSAKKASTSVRPPSQLLLIGRVGRAHGLRGAFFVSERDEPIPLSYTEVWIGASPQEARLAKIRDAKLQGGRPLLLTHLAEDRTAAEKLTGCLLWVERSRVVATDDQSIDLGVDRDGPSPLLLWGDIQACRVVDQAGHEVGTVVDIYNSGASDVLVVRNAKGATLDIALVASYVAFDADGFAADVAAGVLRLTVDAEIFADLWQEL